MKVTKSRNQREGKYIAGWCLNPAYQMNKNGVVVHRKRAGGNYDLFAYRNVVEYGTLIPGISLIRQPRLQGEQQ